MELRGFFVVLSQQFCRNKDLIDEEVGNFYADEEIPQNLQATFKFSQFPYPTVIKRRGSGRKTDWGRDSSFSEETHSDGRGWKSVRDSSSQRTVGRCVCLSVSPLSSCSRVGPSGLLHLSSLPGRETWLTLDGPREEVR